MTALCVISAAVPAFVTCLTLALSVTSLYNVTSTANDSSVCLIFCESLIVLSNHRKLVIQFRLQIMCNIREMTENFYQLYPTSLLETLEVYSGVFSTVSILKAKF